MSRLAAAVIAGLVLGAMVAAAFGGGPWSTAPEPVPVIDLDPPDGPVTSTTTTTTAPPVTPAPASPAAPEVVPPPTVSPAPGPALG